MKSSWICVDASLVVRLVIDPDAKSIHKRWKQSHSPTPPLSHSPTPPLSHSPTPGVLRGRIGSRFPVCRAMR